MHTTENRTTGSQNKIDSDKNSVNIFSIITIVIFTWLLSWILLDCFIPPQNETRSSFGDKFGAVNSLFAALAFAGIIITILLQRKELQLQREELKLQRDEQVATREVFEAQNEMLSQEKFENTFFQMLSLFHSIVNSMDIRSNSGNKDVIRSGRDCFETFYNDFKKKIEEDLNKRYRDKFVKTLTASTKITVDDLSIDDYQMLYDSIYSKFRSDLSHYFRTFYHIIKLIDNSDLSDKQRYASIARAQLSSYEQILLFYNCMHDNGNKKFKPLIEKYALFKNIDYSLLFSKTQKHLGAFETGAYNNI